MGKDSFALPVVALRRLTVSVLKFALQIPTELRRNMYLSSFFFVVVERRTEGNLFSFPRRCVGYERSSRAVASQVLLPLQSLTSVFGMGTGGPSALK